MGGEIDHGQRRGVLADAGAVGDDQSAGRDLAQPVNQLAARDADGTLDVCQGPPDMGHQYRSTFFFRHILNFRYRDSNGRMGQ